MVAVVLGLTASPAFSMEDASSDVSKKAENAAAFVTNNFSMPKFGGYIVGKYDWNDRAGQQTNGGFDLRFLRLYLDGNCFQDFYYKVQLELAGQPGNDKGARILDAFVEWQKYKPFKVKFGQFKRPFTFEDPMHPWSVGIGSYSQLTTKFSGMSDRVGEHSCGGRDIGVQLQGDLFPSKKDGHSFFHYQVGVFNGQGINHSDKNKSKDVIGGLWLSPVKELQIGGFLWSGVYTNESYTGAVNTLKEADRNRWGIGAKYDGLITARAEYVFSQGKSVTNTLLGNKADAWYATLGVPIMKKLTAFGRWDCYRDNKEWSHLKTNWGASLNYSLCKNLMLQGNYTFTNDRSASIGKNYNTIDLEIYARF